VPEFNLYEEYWKIYTNNDTITPEYFASTSRIERCIVAEGSEISGEVRNSVIGYDVNIGKGSVITDSIIMSGTTIGENCTIDKAIIAESVVIGDGVIMGVGEFAPNSMNPKVYAFDLAVVAENSQIPPGVRIGKNTAIVGKSELLDYPDCELASGQSIVKAGDVL